MTSTLPCTQSAPPATISDSPRMRHWLIATAIGIAFALLSLSPRFIAGTAPYWTSPFGDAATGQIGWQYYARDDWRWPVFAVRNYNAPEGSTALLSDSLPLFALPMKVVYKATGWLPNYVGFWIGLCLFLQAVCASRLLLALGVRDWLGQVGGVVLFCYAPILLQRTGHATLMAQWLILIALERYVTAKREGLSGRGWLALCVLPTIAEHAHPYLAVMTSALVFVTAIDQWRDSRIAAAGAALRLGGSAALAVGVALVDGIFRGGGRPYLDYGTYSSNLAAPITPPANTFIGHWLQLPAAIIRGLGQYEGACYLGAGLFVLAIIALARLPHARAALRRHAVLAATLFVLTVVAVSNRIGFGPYELAHVPLPEAVVRCLSVFRGAGRFVWLDVYTLLALLIAVMLSKFGPRRAGVVIASAALVQLVDIAPLQSGLRKFSGSAFTSTIQSARWIELIDSHDRLFQFPSFACGGLFGGSVPGHALHELDIDWIAAKHAKPTNSAYLARSLKDCARERDDAVTTALAPGTLRLYRSSDDVGAYLTQHGVDFSGCGSLDDVVVCSTGRDLSALH